MEGMRQRLRSLAAMPSLHFAAAGLVLFIALSSTDDYQDQPSEQSVPPRTIYVSDARIEVLKQRTESRIGYALDLEETRSVIQDWVTNEILYREALLRSNASNNSAVLNRLRQKLAFLDHAEGNDLKDDELLALAAELNLLDEDIVLRQMFVQTMRLLLAREGGHAPSASELEAHYQTHRDDYRTPARRTWHHVFVDEAKDTSDLSQLTVDLSTQDLQAEAAIKRGDPFPGGHSFSGSTFEHVRTQFGQHFAEALFAAPIAHWSGPVQSPFGSHILFVVSERPERVRAFDEVEDALRLSWTRAQRKKRLEASLSHLTDQYQIIYETEPEWNAGSS